MNTRILFDAPRKTADSLGLWPGLKPPTLSEEDEQTDRQTNAAFPIFSTRTVLRKIRGSKESKCSEAFLTVNSAIKCR